MRGRVERFVDEYGMIQPGMKIVAGISGGADSVCLLFLLREICARKGTGLLAVHVNHGLRGDESDGDEEFVRGLCSRWGVPLKVFRADVQKRAADGGLSLEEAGRKCRYEAFKQAAEDSAGGLDAAADLRGLDAAVPGRTEYRIAVAHHRDDQAETVLFNLFRGSGIRGLSGMEPVKGDVIRPLLCVGRKEIQDFLVSEGIGWRTDSSNLDNGYARNRIRNELLPYVSEHINTQAPAHIADAAFELSAIEGYLERETDEAFKLCVRDDGDSYFIYEKPFAGLDPVIRQRVLRRCMGLTGGLKDVGRIHVAILDKMIEGRTGARADLPGGRSAVKEYGGVRLGKKEYLDAGSVSDAACGSRMGDGTAVETSDFPCRVYAGGHEWSFSVNDAAPGDKIIPQKTYTKWFDCDRISDKLAVRHRKPGDFMEINAQHGRKPLKKFFIDEKVPERMRGELWLLADGSHVVWIPGMRISEYYKVTSFTEKILKVEIDGGDKDG